MLNQCLAAVGHNSSDKRQTGGILTVSYGLRDEGAEKPCKGAEPLLYLTSVSAKACEARAVHPLAPKKPGLPGYGIFTFIPCSPV